MHAATPGKVARAVTFLFYFCWQTSQAAAFSVAPVRVNLDEAANSATVEFGNTGTEITSMQVEVMKWSQTEDGVDVYEPSEDLIAVPPIFRVEPGEKQIVRIGLFGRSAPAETSFRVFFSELPQEQPDRVTTPVIKMRLRIGIPVFIASLEIPDPRLEMINTARDDNKLSVTFHNPGNTHVQVKWLYVLAEEGDDAEVVADGAGAYLLPGTTREFALKSPGDSPVAAVRAQTDTAGTADYALPADP